MDDTTNRAYSRAPEIDDLLALCRALNQNYVQYMLIGGFAVILHGFVRGTKDIDLLIDPSEENVARIKLAMAHLPDNAIALIENDEIEKYQVVRIADEITVDLMAQACGIRYNEARNHVEWRTIDGVKIPLADKAALIRMKDTLRPSDKMDVIFLQNLIEEERKK